MLHDKHAIILSHVIFSVYLVFLVSIIFSWRGVSSLSIGMLLFLGLTGRPKVVWDPFTRFLAGCSLLFLWNAISLLFSVDVNNGISLLARSSGLVFIPLAVLVSHHYLRQRQYHQLMQLFSIFLSVAGLFCVFQASVKWANGGDPGVLFYHQLAAPIAQHAVQLSLLILIALVYLIQNYIKTIGRSGKSLWLPVIVFLSLFLLLLSSKLVICSYVAYLLWNFFKRLTARRAIYASLFLSGSLLLVLVTNNPIGLRFRDLFAGDTALFKREKFDESIYFNGLQFRLLQWKLTGEILTEKKAVLLGVTPADAQELLDLKYKSYKMYQGRAGTSDHGYAGYHTHNQYLQCLLEGGLVAFVLFTLVCICLIAMAYNRRGIMMFFILVLVAYSFTDAPLQTQYGLVIFCFFPAFLYQVRNSIVPFGQSEISPAGFLRVPTPVT